MSYNQNRRSIGVTVRSQRCGSLLLTWGEDYISWCSSHVQCSYRNRPPDRRTTHVGEVLLQRRPCTGRKKVVSYVHNVSRWQRPRQLYRAKGICRITRLDQRSLWSTLPPRRQRVPVHPVCKDQRSRLVEHTVVFVVWRSLQAPSAQKLCPSFQCGCSKRSDRPCS